MPADIRLPNSGFYALCIFIICTYIHTFIYISTQTQTNYVYNQALMQTKKKST